MSPDQMRMMIIRLRGLLAEYHKLEVCSRNEMQRVNRAKTIADHIDNIKKLDPDGVFLPHNSNFEDYIRSIATIKDSKYI